MSNSSLIHANAKMKLIMVNEIPALRLLAHINGAELTMQSCVKLLSIEADNKLNFEKHISNTCKNASNQLNGICRLQTFMGYKEKEAIINTFLDSNFNYGCLIWLFNSKKSQNKVKKNS